MVWNEMFETKRTELGHKIHSYPECGKRGAKKKSPL